MFTVYEGLHTEFNVDRLHIPRKDGGRDLITIEDCVEFAVGSLEVYVRMIQAASGDKLDGLGSKRFKESQEKEAIARLGG